MDDIRTIFFDFGNVIAYFDHDRATKRLAAFTTISHDALHQALYQRDRFAALETGLLESGSYIKQVLADGRLSCNEECFRLAFADIFAPNHDVCGLIPRLASRHRLVLASNTNSLHAEFFLQAFQDTLAHFRKLVLSHDVKARKPDAMFYACCQEWADCSPGQCLFIDDRADNVAAARAHGWRAIEYVSFEILQHDLRRLGVYNE
jgi:putative hydrolase of the HAD superfamily